MVKGEGLALIEVKNLHKTYKSIAAVSDLSFSVDSGEFFGFLGPNGAGKTTTIKILATLVRPTSGTVTLNGYDVVRQAADVRRSIGMVFQDPSLDERLTAVENMELHGMLYGMQRGLMKAEITKLLELVDLGDRRNDMVRSFSGGMKRRLEIARGLLHQPPVLFLDEPTVGLDPQTRKHIWDYISEVRKSRGATIFLTTHYMEEAEGCHRVGIIDHGRLVAIDTPSALKKSALKDVLTLRTSDPAVAVAIIRDELGIEPDLDGETITLTAPDDGESYLARLVALIPGITAIGVNRPTLEDVFLKLTGRDIRDEPVSALDRMRTRHRSVSRRGKH